MLLLRRLWWAPLAVLFVLDGSNAAEAAGKRAKPRVKAAALTIKVRSLNKKTPLKEAVKLKKAIKKVKGVLDVKVNRKLGKVIVRHRPAAAPAAIKDAIVRAGFSVASPEHEELPGSAAEEEEEEP